MAIMTVFTAEMCDDRSWIMIHDERSGEIWEEPVHDWEYIIEVDMTTAPETHDTPKMRSTGFPAQSYYRHKDGRIALEQTR